MQCWFLADCVEQHMPSPSRTVFCRRRWQYLEVSLPRLLRYVQSGQLMPSHIVRRNQMFSAQILRAFKRARY